MTNQRALLFIDGSNFYHALKSIGLSTNLNYSEFGRKLVQDRHLVGIRYYVGEVRNDLSRSRQQRQFLERIRKQGVHVILGRVERKLLDPDQNPFVTRLRAIINDQCDGFDAATREALMELCEQPFPQFVEKRVDVAIAVDMLEMAHGDKYDVAYLLSADGDFVPAVEAVKRAGKKIFAAGPKRGDELNRTVDAFIVLKREWFDGLSV